MGTHTHKPITITLRLCARVNDDQRHILVQCRPLERLVYLSLLAVAPLYLHLGYMRYVKKAITEAGNGSSTNGSNTPFRKGRKRVRMPEMWKKNVAKGKTG